MNPTDTFFVIGLTSEDILAHVDFGILKLSDYSLKNSMQLNQQFGPLRPAIRKGLVVEEEGEVFFLFDATDFEGAQIYKQQFGDKYFEIKFLNDVAFQVTAGSQDYYQSRIARTPILRSFHAIQVLSDRGCGDWGDGHARLSRVYLDSNCFVIEHRATLILNGLSYAEVTDVV